MFVTSYGRNKNLDDEIETHSRTSSDVQLQEISLTKHQIDLKRTRSELGKPFLKKRDPIKKTENQCQSVACEDKTTSEKWKLGSYKKLGLE